MAESYGFASVMRYLGIVAIQSLLLFIVLRALRRRIGPEPNTLANALTLTRVLVGCILAALALSGAHDRTRPTAVVVWVLVIVSASVGDWLDGPLARREGPTQFGAVLDIESDSWLTLWCAVAAVTMGGLPWICIVPPVVRYIHPLLDLRGGKLPSGGGPWWSRATGAAQMVMLVVAIAPITGAARDAVLGVLVWPVSLMQLATMLALLLLRRR
jgi:phosphatidylglycerophosphate synthase